MIAELNQRLVEAREAYYAGHPVMSDSQFDILEAQLAGMIKNAVELTDQATVLTTVGPGGRVPHRFPMRSIENRYTEEALTEFLYVDETLTLSSKWDGISVSIEFDDHGSLRQALTRGDGDAGEDITAQVLAVEAIPKCIPQGPLNIRGELVIAQSTLESLNLTLQAKGLKPYSSTRNLVAGTMKLKDVTLIPGRKVQFRPWEVLGDPLAGSLGDSAIQRLRQIAAWGFEAPDDVVITTTQELLTNLRIRLAELKREKAEIGRDGFVLKVDSIRTRERMGVGSKFARFQVCFKPQNAKSESVLREVQWQVGRQGRLTPVGVIDPVVLAGAEITRVTLNNETWIKDMGLEIGSRVAVVRSGDVIPQITEVLQD